ncbi:MAG: RtcB family protein [Candidatus Wallbacteria bacterium]|nr:RtcB family protein [Candidatus Wallbacteria bacterium]
MNYELKKIAENFFMVKRHGRMKVNAVVVSREDQLAQIGKDKSLHQLVNMAALPGAVDPVLAMPDMHQGYGFPIGGVGVFNTDEGIVSPGGVGYDINCGVRLLATGLHFGDIEKETGKISGLLGSFVPAGVGRGGKYTVKDRDLENVLEQGCRWAVKKGFADQSDLERIEDGGCLTGAEPDSVSERAKKRGFDQLGTLGSGNHFLEIQRVDQIYNPAAARHFGLSDGQVTVMIHSGSRGLGYQVCDDYLAEFLKYAHREKIELPERELAYAALDSDEARSYLGAMSAAANYAFVNRQLLSFLTEETLQRMFPGLRLSLIYDVCHNIAKFEEFEINGRTRQYCVHRKGATRALPPGHPLLPECYRPIGQPAIIPGSMGTASYLLVGKPEITQKTFNSVCHGAGRLFSRKAATRKLDFTSLMRDLEQKGIVIFGHSKRGLLEEMPDAYKDIDTVVDVVEKAGLAVKIARFVPMVVIKG